MIHPWPLDAHGSVRETENRESHPTGVFDQREGIMMAGVTLDEALRVGHRLGMGSYLQRVLARPGILSADEVVDGCHAMTPAYLSHQLDISRQALGLERIDLFHLHNPEQQRPALGPEGFRSRRIHKNPPRSSPPPRPPRWLFIPKIDMRGSCNDRSVGGSKPNETFNAEGRGKKQEDRGGCVWCLLGIRCADTGTYRNLV
jgi:hypothetical protein